MCLYIRVCVYVCGYVCVYVCMVLSKSSVTFQWEFLVGRCMAFLLEVLDPSSEFK